MFILDKFSRVPVYEQIIDQVETLVMQGILRSGDLLPSVRQLSAELSVNPNTLQKAYAELDRRGICVSSPGNGRFITADALSVVRSSKSKGLTKIKEISVELAAAGVEEELVHDAVSQAYAAPVGGTV